MNRSSTPILRASRAPLLGLGLGLGLMLGCVSHDLTPAGRMVVVSSAPAQKGCQPVGYVTGQATNPLSSAYVTRDEIFGSAINDVRNHAAELGATYAQTLTVNEEKAEGAGSRIKRITMGAVAYKCAP